MRAAQIQDDKIVINKLPDLRLDGRRGALVEVLGCGLCGSDIVKFVQKSVPDGTVLGHEIVARVLEVNSDTDFQTGDVILSSHHVPCRQCVYCKHGNESMCAHFKSTNFEPGGFSELVYLSEEHLQNMAYKKPENLSNDEAAFYEPLGCCVRAIRRADLKPGDRALVVGLGSIGLLMAQALNTFGMDVEGFDLKPERMALLAEKLRSLGVRSEATGQPGGCSAVFMTSGSDAAIETALKSVRDGGKIVVFSGTPHNFGYTNNEIYYRELTVMGSYSPAPVDLQTSLNLLASGKVDVKNLSTIYDFENINNAFQDTVANKTFKAYVRINNQKHSPGS
jgi:L-iditol 2-dehydrogenase